MEDEHAIDAVMLDMDPNGDGSFLWPSCSPFVWRLTGVQCCAAGEVDFEEFSSWYQGFVGAQEGEEEATASMGKFFNRLSPAKRREKKELEVTTCRLAP